MKMRILFLADGSLNHTWRWVEYFAGRGHDVHLITLEDPPSLPCTTWKLDPQVPFVKPLRYLFGKLVGKKPFTPGEPAFPIPKMQIFGYLLNVPIAKKIIAAVRPDLVSAQQVGNYGLLGALTGFRPLAVSALGTDVLILPKRSWLDKKRVVWALGRADLITSMADHMTDVLVDELGADAEKIIVNHFGIDPTIFLPTDRPPRPADEVVLISTRYHRPVYNLQQLLRALPTVFNELPRSRLIMLSDGPETARLKRLADELGVAARVEFLGPQPTAAVAEHLRDADIYINVSRSDGANISLMEGMISGCYPICTDIPACTQWVVNGENGTIVPLDDPAALARAIVEAAQDPSARARVREPNVGIVRARGLWEDNMRRSEDAFVALVEKSRTMGSI